MKKNHHLTKILANIELALGSSDSRFVNLHIVCPLSVRDVYGLSDQIKRSLCALYEALDKAQWDRLMLKLSTEERAQLLAIIGSKPAMTLRDDPSPEARIARLEKAVEDLGRWES